MCSAQGVDGKAVYISGPMEGRPNFNAGAFKMARIELYQAGASWVFDPAEKAEDFRSREQAMRYDLAKLTSMGLASPCIDCVFMLRGWNESRGACLERRVAMECGIGVLYQEGGLD